MIDNTIRKEVYDGDGSTVEWTIPFDYSDTEQVKLYTITDDVETEITTNFSINNNVITYPVDGVPVPEGTKVLVIRKTPLKQLESSVETPFTSADVERALDKLTCEVQEVKEDVDRALKSPEWSKESADVLLKQVQQEVATFESQLSAETSNRISADSTLSGKIDTINSKIPSEASSSNKLADKNYVQSGLSSKQDTIVSGVNIKTINGNSVVGSGNLVVQADLPSQTGNSGRFLTTDGSNPSWADVNTNLPTFPAPSETVSTVAYTAAGGTSGILGKEIQSITFDSNDTAIFNPAISSGPETMACRIGRGSSYVPADDVLLTFNFTIYNNTVSYAELVAQKYDPDSESMITLGSLAFVADFGNGPEWMPYDSSIWLGNGINIYWDSVNKKIWSDLNFIAINLLALGDAVDNVFVFETITQNNTLPAASGYANKLAYVYETGTYSDIKNLIYSNGTSWQFLPGAVLEIPDERMHDTVQKVVPAYCGIPLVSGQFAIPARNKSDAAQTNYSAGQMHEFYSDSSNWLNRFWSPMNFGTIFSGNYPYLGQSGAEEYQQLWPQTYSYTIFKNEGYTTHTQRVIVYLGNMANFCYAVFAQGTNKIQLEFDSATNAKVFLNGQEVNTSNNLVLDADTKTYIANFYDYSDSSGYLVMDIKELPYNPANKVIALSSSTATLATNTNYTATVSGSAAFTLPIPSNTSVENVINILLTVSATTTIDWGVNINSVLRSFAAGKYEIRLRYNNATSNWIGEVLKQEATPSHTKCFVSFNENYADQTNNITLTPNFTPAYSDATGYTAFSEVKSLQTSTGSTSYGFTLSDTNNALTFNGIFTFALWVRIGSSPRNTYIFKNGTTNLQINGTGELYLGGQYISSSNIWLTESMHYVEINRDSDNKIRYFVDGVLQNGSSLTTMSNTVKFSDSTLCFTSSNDVSHYFQDLVITDEAGHTANYNVPTAPYVLADNSLADYHDDTKQDVLTSITGYDATKTQVLKNVQGVLTWVDEA